jgi:hypothetical protein
MRPTAVSIRCHPTSSSTMAALATLPDAAVVHCKLGNFTVTILQEGVTLVRSDPKREGPQDRIKRFWKIAAFAN